MHAQSSGGSEVFEYFFSLVDRISIIFLGEEGSSAPAQAHC